MDSSFWDVSFLKFTVNRRDSTSTILEARAGPDGIFRVEGETAQEDELEKIREKIRKDREELERYIIGRWDPK
jgi:hypothetical protein